MAIKTAYFGFEVSDPQAWLRYGELIGFQPEETEEGLFFRVDEKARRLQFVEGPSDDIAWLGWEAESVDAFERLRRHLEATGVATQDGDGPSARLRGVEHFFHFVDPNGVRFEIAIGLRDGPPFSSAKVPGGFRTGELGLGHAAFNSTDHLADERFMREALKANLSDYIHQRMPDGSMMHAVFLHTNPRHHSVAFAEGLGAGSRLNHFELELNEMADVGRVYERLQAAGVTIALSLGQHSNDGVVSFYALTPSKFMMEIGCHGIRIDDEESWKPTTYDRISEWGHKFQLA